MGRFQLSSFRTILQKARAVSTSTKTPYASPFCVLHDELTKLGLLEAQTLGFSRCSIPRHKHEAPARAFGSCSGAEQRDHPDFDDLGDPSSVSDHNVEASSHASKQAISISHLESSTLDLKGFYNNAELILHASKQAIIISDSALERFLHGKLRDSSSYVNQDFDPQTSCGSSGTQSTTLSSEEDDLMSFFKGCMESGPSQEVVLFVNASLFPLAAHAFQIFFEQNCSSELGKQLLEMEPSDVRQKVLFPMFTDFCQEQYSEEMQRFQALLKAADMSKPHALFPAARKMKRKIIYHYGPTNSGKTYNALQRFLQEPNGVYCSPLRLLAMEVSEYSNSKGVPCNLVTGQEKKEVPEAKHVACTVEMVVLQQVWKVAIIDEVQLLSDDNRGWAWTRALLGLQANELHLCGDHSALPVIRSLCASTGDEFEEHGYERFKPLAVDTDSLNGDFRNAQPGDCIVTFSRREIFDIKRAVQRATKKRCCVVYGALPPETRSQQAKLFNEPDNKYEILVASDAVGMGLNLNIRRVVFYTMQKFDGELNYPIPVSLAKQIAGRAGRRGSLYPEGLVTTFQASDLPHLFSSLDEPLTEACGAGLFPALEQLQLFAEHMPDAKFSELLERFVETSHVDAYYFLCQNRALRKVAALIDSVPNLTLEERFIFYFAPVNGRNPKSLGALFQYAKSYSQRQPLELLVGKPSLCPEVHYQLLDLEEKYHLLQLYLWLSQHFPAEFFPQIEKARSMSVAVASTLGQSLTNLRD